jgi:broad specificity phosphatase PhoE
MTTIALVRHGQTDWNLRGLIQGVTDNPLNATGRTQAVEAAELLQTDRWALPWSGVVTSPLIRAAETGAVIATTLGLPVHDSVPGLTERDYGLAEGLEMVEAHVIYPDHAYPQSEPNSAVAERGITALDDLHDAFAGEHVIAVAHGGFIQTVLSALLGAPVEPILNTAVSIVEWTGPDSGWVVRAINNEMLAA